MTSGPKPDYFARMLAWLALANVSSLSPEDALFPHSGLVALISCTFLALVNVYAAFRNKVRAD